MTVCERPVSDELLHAYGRCITEQTGMLFDPERWPELHGLAQALPLCAGPVDRAAVQALALQLSVGETYFFRDPAAFGVLEHELLPPLIARRRRSTRRLRLWSAGCCTGEEAYSLAIVLERLIPDIADWDIDILGTDIHPGFLTQAETGVYGDWSFRGVPPSVRSAHFRPLDGQREAVAEPLRRLTRFRFGNLAQDDEVPCGVDLILCRHVLMYFEPHKAQQAIERLQAALVDGGWLLLGPTESPVLEHPSLAPLRFGDTVVHCKRACAAPALATLAARPGPTHEAAARLDDEIALCHVAIAADKCDPALHLRHALLLEHAGRSDEARAALRRALFLDAQLSAAQVALARLNERAAATRSDAAGGVSS